MIPSAAKWVAKPCIELGYVRGVVHGDGSVSKNETQYHYIVELSTIDPEFAITFSRAASRLLGVNYHEPWWNKKRKVWRVMYQSKAFYTWYKRTEKQGLQGFKPFIEHDIETVKYYLKGLFDSDGSNNENKQIFLFNTKEELLKYVQYLLKKYFGIIATGPYLKEDAEIIYIKRDGEKIERKHNCYEISVSRKSHVQKYLEEIGFSIVRKQLGLKKHEKVYIEGIGYVKPYRLVELGLFKLPFSDTQ